MNTLNTSDRPSSQGGEHLQADQLILGPSQLSTTESAGMAARRWRNPISRYQVVMLG